MRQILNSRLTVLVMVVIIISLASGVAWASGSSSPSSQASDSGAGLIVQPLTVVAGSPSLDILGSGFGPSTPVFVQIILDETFKMSVTGVSSNAAGAFHKKVTSTEADLVPGVYTVLAIGLEGARASAPLLVVEEAK